MAILTVVTCILLGSVFAKGAAPLLSIITNTDVVIITVIIFTYFFIATIFPVDKIIGRIYPIFGAIFILMSANILIAILTSQTYHIPEFTTQGVYFSKNTIFPYLFVTVACGAISGFHSSQTPIAARCIENEKDTRLIFFGSMILEGIVALIWAAVTMSFFNGQPQLALLFGQNPSEAVRQIATTLLGPLGLFLTIIGVVICPITSGDTSLRASRITIADELKIEQKSITSRFKIAIPILICSFILTFIDFNIIWRYFAWLLNFSYYYSIVCNCIFTK